MNNNSGNIPIHVNTIVENGASHRVNIQLCLILPFDRMVQCLQDSARTSPEQPHFLAHEITITIDGVLYPFHAQLDFKELIYADKKRHKVEVTMHCTTVATKPPKLSQRLFAPVPAYVPSTPQRSISRGRSQSSMGASSSMKSVTKPSRASAIETATTPAKRSQIAAHLPAVPQSTTKPAPATCVISVGSFKAPQVEEIIEAESMVHEEEEAVVMPPAVPSAAEKEEEVSAKMATLPTTESSSVKEEEPSAAAEAHMTVEFVAAPAVLVAVAQTPKAAKKALKKKEKKSASSRKKFAGKQTFTLKNDEGETEGYETAEGSDDEDNEGEDSDEDEDEEEQEEVVEQEVPIAVPEGPSTPLVDPAESLFSAPEQVESITTSLTEEVEAEAVQEVQDEEEASAPSVDSNSAKTPEKTRSLSNPRGRASTTKSAAAASSARKNINKRMTTCETPTSTLYNAPGARNNCVTQGEIANMLQNQLHRTTGSISTALSGAAFNPNASLGSATKMPRSTPAKKAAPAKSANTSTATAGGMDLSPIRMTVSKTGRPSIGTIETQWEYMRSNFFNNDDEEIVWSMVSKKRGAYAHAHKKYNHAEDRYFRCIYDIATSEANIESLRSGAAARVVALLGELEKICQEHAIVGATADVSARYKATLDTLRTHIDANSNEETQESVMSCFSATTEMGILGLVNNEFADRDMSKNLRQARSIYNRLDKEKENLAHVLAKANKESEVALEYMEKWSRREKEANDYAETMRDEETEWLATHLCDNFTAFQLMRAFVPVNVFELQVADIMALAKKQDGLMSLELATEIKQNKLLHWIVTHTEDIATDSFLTGEKKAIFENFESLDIVEMRAIVSVLPRKFENDKDGKKAEWRARFFARVRQLVSQQNGDLVKGSYDPKINQRAMVAQPGLKPEQARRAVYFFRTKEKSAIKLKQYTDRIALLARRENAVVTAKAAVTENKQEYDVLLQESRDASFIQTYGAEVLSEVKDAAKADWQAAVNTLKCAESDLANLRKTIESMPLTYEQYQEQEAEMVAYLAAHGVDWTAKGLAAQEIEGVFDESVPVEKMVKQGLKFVSAEEEAALRKADLEALLSRKTESAMAVAAANASAAGAEGETGSEEGADSARESANPSPTDFGAVPCTPGGENASESGPTAPNTEFKKLSTAALGIFSPTTTRTQSEYSIHAVTAFETPRKRNSVLMNANPDMLNTLNKMLMNSPAATPLKNARQSLFNAASASKFAIKNSSAADETEGKEGLPQVKAVTRSKLLMKRLTPSFGSNSGNLSPKRSVGMPKFNFLSQLTGRANGLKPSNANTGDDASSGPAVAPSAAPGGPGRGAMSFFADIARFRKPDAEEVAVSSSGAAEENSSPKENGDKSNVEPSKALSAMLFKKAHSTSSVGGGNPMMAKPMLSMFDEIRKRRVIE